MRKSYLAGLCLFAVTMLGVYLYPSEISFTPVISPAKAQNGETIYFQARIKADSPPDKVEVLINDRKATHLKQKEFDKETNAGFWSQKWIANDLVSQTNQVTFQVTDASGRVIQKGPYHIFNPLVGNEEIKEDTRMFPLGKQTLLSESHLLSCAIDSQRGYAYFGTGTFPGQVIKISLDNEHLPPQRTGTLVLEEGESWLSTVVFDEETNRLYSGTGTDPAKIVKIDAGEQGELPRRLDSITLENGEAHLEAAFIDKTGEYAYWGTQTSPARIIKTRLADEENTFKKVQTLTLKPGENNITNAIYDPGTQKAYFLLRSRPGSIVMVDTAGEKPRRLGKLDFHKGEDLPVAAVFNAETGIAYFGTATDPAQIIKVSLARSNQEFKRLTALSPAQEIASISSGMYDDNQQKGYFSTRTRPAHLIPFSFSENDSILFGEARVLEDGASRIMTGGVDTQQGTFYFAGETSPGKIVFTRSSSDDFKTLPLERGEDNISVILTDDKTGYSYAATATHPGKIIQINEGSRIELPERKNAITLADGQNMVISGTLDKKNGLAYFGTWDGTIVQVALERDDQPFEKLLSFSPAETFKRPAVALFDDTTNHVYFGTDTLPGRIFEVDAGDGSSLPRLRSTTELSPEKGNLISGVMYPRKRYALFGTSDSPGSIIKIDLKDENSLTAYTGTLELEEGENNLATAFADEKYNEAFFSTISRPSRLIRIKGGKRGELPRRIESLELADNEYHAGCSMFDPESRTAYIGTETLPARLVQVRIGKEEEPMQRLSSIEALRLRAASFTSDNKALLLGMYTSPGRLFKVLPTQENLIHGTPVTLQEPGNMINMHLYALSTSGTMQVAVYDSETLTLLWQSEEIIPQKKGWMEIPVQEGDPSALKLEKGNYLLVWQTDHVSQGCAYHRRETPQAYIWEKDFDAFPSILPAEQKKNVPVEWNITLELKPE